MSIMVVLYIFCLPKELFTKPTSTVIVSKEGELLGALIAKDGQWRFPQNDEVPEKFEKCVTNFEDEYFYWHPGFNPISIGKALWQNYKAKEVVRGGSTITQQVIRLSRDGTPRTYFEKIKELVLASRLEFRASVLSLMTTAPRAWAAAEIAGMSWTSKVWEPGASVSTTLVLSRRSSAMPPPISGS